MALVLLMGCGIKPKIPSVHRIPVQQGNYLEYDDVSQVNVGMSKADVEAILGTPVVGSLFNQSRWEYVYRLRTERYGLFENLYTVYFEDDIVARIESTIKEPIRLEETVDPENIEGQESEVVEQAEGELLEKAEEALEQVEDISAEGSN